VTELLVPVQQGLKPVQASADRGAGSEPISLSSTSFASWRIVPARGGGSEEVEAAWCSIGSNDIRHLYLRTYRFYGGR